MCVLMFTLGPMMFEEPPSLRYDTLRDEKGIGTKRLQMDTFMFHTFMLMNLFNAINCRAGDPEQLNLFAGMTAAKWFFVVLSLEFAVQQLMINCGSQQPQFLAILLGTGELSLHENVACYLLGIMSVPVGLLAKKFANRLSCEFTKKWTLEQGPQAMLPCPKVVTGNESDV